MAARHSLLIDCIAKYRYVKLYTIAYGRRRNGSPIQWPNPQPPGIG